MDTAFSSVSIPQKSHIDSFSWHDHHLFINALGTVILYALHHSLSLNLSLRS
jgi:hypothetical protein